MNGNQFEIDHRRDGTILSTRGETTSCCTLRGRRRGRRNNDEILEKVLLGNDIHTILETSFSVGNSFLRLEARDDGRDGLLTEFIDRMEGGSVTPESDILGFLHEIVTLGLEGDGALVGDVVELVSLLWLA